MPIQQNFENVQGSFRGSWYILDTIGQLLSSAGGEIVRGVVFDAATTHSFVRRCFHGEIADLDPDELRSTPFFGSLVYSPLPRNSLPRLPVKIATIDGQVVWGVPGACNLDRFVWDFELFLWFGSCFEFP